MTYVVIGDGRDEEFAAKQVLKLSLPASSVRQSATCAAMSLSSAGFKTLTLHVGSASALGGRGVGWMGFYIL